jgi:DNA-binding NarL/FixJ family response regulator
VETPAVSVRVLLVEDRAELRALVRELLEGEDIEVVGEAPDGETAERLAASLHPDVVLMDLWMPGIGGIEATRRIRRANPTVEVVMLTDYDSPQAQRSSVEAGACAYLVKGCSVELLLGVLRLAAQHELGAPPCAPESGPLP